MPDESPVIENRSTVEVPPAVIDEIAALLPDDVESQTVRDFCFDYLERDTQFVTPDGQSVETAVLQR